MPLAHTSGATADGQSLQISQHASAFIVLVNDHPAIRTILALRIMAAVKDGVRDPEQLKLLAKRSLDDKPD